MFLENLILCIRKVHPLRDNNENGTYDKILQHFLKFSD